MLERLSTIPLLQIAHRWDVPVFIDAELHPRWTLKQGSLKKKILVTTIPKAGTFMMAKLMPVFGVADCGVQLQNHSIDDHRFAPERLRRHYPTALNRSIELTDAVQLIGSGQFAFGHIGLENETLRSLFSDFKVVVVCRDMRHICVSLARYRREIRRDTTEVQQAALFLDSLSALLAWELDHDGPRRLASFRQICAWRDEPNALLVRYEDMIGEFGRERQIDVMHQLREFLDATVDDSTLEAALNTVIGQPTVTKTERHTVASEYWNDKIERLYQRVGFPSLNRELGYEEPE